MNKLLSYFVMGTLTASLGLFACTVTTNPGDDDDDENTSSSSSGGSSGKNSSGGSSSGGNGSSSGGSSSGGESGDTPADNLSITSVEIDPDTATVGTAGDHTYTINFTGTPALDPEGGVAVIYGVAKAPEGVTQQQAAGILSAFKIDQQQSAAGKVVGTLKFNPPAAGEYEIALGFSNQPSDENSQDAEFKTVVVTAAE